MKFFILLCLTIICSSLNAQTNVSGGIFSNTTWAASGSPYIVTANVVVFPGYTLTIQPGVTIKFDDNVSMEIRQSSLIANGTPLAPIIFTSNNSSPVRGSWDKIFVNQSPNIQINHCEFHFAATGLTGQAISMSLRNSVFTQNILGLDASSTSPPGFQTDSCIFRNNDTGQSGYVRSVTNCIYKHNNTGLYAATTCNVFNCIIDSNSTYGLLKHMACGDTLRDNEIKYNGVGIAHDFSGCGGTIYIHNNVIEKNTVGILMQYAGGVQVFEIHHNSICSNTTYNIQNLTALNMNTTNNCWCSTNTSYIASTIYDAYDDVSMGIVSFLPIDSLLCPMTEVGIKEINEPGFHMYPNPATTELNIVLDGFTKELQLQLLDITGRLVSENKFTTSTKIDVTAFPKGIYIIRIKGNNMNLNKKVMLVD